MRLFPQKQNKSNLDVSTYHLITDNNQTKFEINEYQNNVINKVGSIGYIWRMHNWRKLLKY